MCGATSSLVWVLARRSQYAPAASLTADLIRVGREANDPHLESFGLVCAASMGVVVGPLDEAVQQIEQARSISRRLSATRMHANAGSVLAKCLLRQGRIAQASDVLHESMAVLEARGISDLFFIESVSAFTELWLIQAECQSGVERKRALRAARSACAKALRCANKAAVAWRPETTRLHGTLAWLGGERSLAIRRWRKSIEIADQLKLPIDRARGLLEIGERTNDEPLVEQARGVFEAIGAQVDLALSLHVLARRAATAGAVEVALQRYAAAIAALEAAQADEAFRVATRERSRLLAASGRRDDARAEANPS